MNNYDLSFIESENELRSYFLGLWMADGWVNGNSVRISLSDYQLISDLASMLRYRNKILETRNRKFGSTELSGTTQYHIVLTNKHLARWMTGLGPVYKKTGKEFIPHCVSVSTFNHFLRGLSDGDGSFIITESGTRLMYSLVSASAVFLNTVLDALRSSSVIAAPRLHVRRAQTTYVFNLGHTDSVRLGDYIYLNATVKMNHKYECYQKGKNIAKTRSYKLWTREEDRLLLTGGYPPTRSTSSCRARLARLRS